MKLKEKYVVFNGSVENMCQISETDTEYVLVPQNQIVTIKKDSCDIFNDKFDAMYHVFLDRIKSGKSVLKNYKSSKFFKQYLERLQEQNPELLFS